MKNKEKLTEKETKNALKFAHDLQKTKDSLPDENKNILDWSMIELKTYLKVSTQGMNPRKKIQFTNDLYEKIKKEKKKRGIKK